MGMQSKIDTSPRIELYGYKVPVGSGAYVEAEGYGITFLYTYPAQNYKQTFVSYGVGCDNIRIFKNGKYMDYWNWSTEGSTVRRTVINIQSDGFIIGVNLALLDQSYMFCEETGQIFFAGKNSIYYGHRNISELN